MAETEKPILNRVGKKLKIIIMEIKDCSYDLGTKIVEGCSPCRLQNFKTHESVKFGYYRLIITRMFQIKTCFEGFAGGNLINAFSLLPGEENEIEVIRKSKYSRELHMEQSIENEFESEVTDTMRLELGASQDFNFSQSAGGGFDFFGLVEANASASASQHLHFDQNFFKETIRKSATRISRKYDISMDIKTEVENKFRSLRKIKNPNPCKVVTYFFKQLNKKFKVEVSLVDVRYDWVRELPQVFAGPLNYSVARKEMISPINEEIASTPTLKKYLIKDTAIEVQEVKEKSELANFKELPQKQLELKMKYENINARYLKQMEDYIKKAEGNPNYKIGVIYTGEYCLRTDNVVAEPKVSECSICDCDGCDCSCQHNPEEQALRLEKMKVELEILKKQLSEG